MHDPQRPLRIRGRIARSILIPTILLALVACGGGSGTDGGLQPAPNPPPTGGGGGGGSGGGGTPAELAGGVLATFQVGTEQFRLWTDVSTTAQTLVDAFAGTIAPITTICADVGQDPGQGGHNAPWNWHVRTELNVSFGPICFGCAAAWSTPTLAEAGLLAGPPYNCDEPQGGARGMVSMQVVLLDVQDYR